MEAVIWNNYIYRLQYIYEKNCDQKLEDLEKAITSYFIDVKHSCGCLCVWVQQA